MMGLDNGIKSFVTSIADMPLKKQPNDYTAKDGILYCGKCNQPRQAWIDWFPDKDGKQQMKLVPVMCHCDMEKEEQEKERMEQLDFDESMRKMRLVLHTQRDDIRWRFDMDDDPNNPIAKTCREYVDKWDSMLKENVGIIFFGNKGTGKTFYASCIYNALKAKRVLVGFTSTPNLMNILSKWDKTEIFDEIARAKLLIIDDLGAERGNEYSAELIYSVIDARYKTGKPTIITTNLDYDDMKREEDLWRSRIYDRVIEMCPVPIQMTGKSRRVGIADERKEIARGLLDWTKRGNS